MERKKRTYVWIVCATDAFVQYTVSQSHIEEQGERGRRCADGLVHPSTILKLLACG